MSFLNKFKYHFHTKQLDDLFITEKHSEIITHLGTLENNQQLFYELSLKYISNVINKLNKDIFDRKIVWINSYLHHDLDYLVLFLENYLNNFNTFSQKIDNYENEITAIIKKEKQIDFNAFVNHSYFFQWMILNSHRLNYKFIRNDLPFFSSENGFNFTKSNITQSFIFVVNHPYAVYQAIKKNNNNDPEIARNIFLNLDHKSIKKKLNDTEFHMNKQGWHTHSQSWLDANVANSLRGKAITIKELQENTYETLSSIILHLIQSGVKIELNYDFIDEFIQNNSFSVSNTGDISQKEKKFLNGYIDEIMNTYDFE